MIDETFKWFTPADLSKYEGQYVCIVGKKVVSADADPEIAYSAAQKKYPNKEIVIWKVPAGKNFIFGKKALTNLKFVRSEN